jgi:hypothetical protein
MRSALVSPREYRAFAAQCLRWAGRAKCEEHRTMMLQMANHWMQTAQALEAAGTCPSAPSETSLVSRPSQVDAEKSEREMRGNRVVTLQPAR